MQCFGEATGVFAAISNIQICSSAIFSLLRIFLCLHSCAEFSFFFEVEVTIMIVKLQRHHRLHKVVIDGVELFGT